MLPKIFVFVMMLAECKAQSLQILRGANKFFDASEKGRVIATFKIPQDGYYVFRLSGGFQPSKPGTIYYCEYILALESKKTQFIQSTANIASQAQDGDICDFSTNEKNNQVAGIFHEGETVELRILLRKCEVNGQPHQGIRTTSSTRVSVQQVSPVYAKE